MPFNISEFRSITSKRGLARSSHYAINIIPPASLNHPVVIDLPLLCDSANLPGVQFVSDEIKHKGFGLMEKRPSGITFDETTVTIIGDSKGEVLSFLEEWTQLISIHDDETDSNSLELFNYPDEYWGTIEIYTYDISSGLYQTYTIKKAWPSNIAGIQLGWEQTDTLVRIPVTFSFRNYSRNANYSGAAPNINSDNSRNVEELTNLLENPNIPDYQRRFESE